MGRRRLGWVLAFSYSSFFPDACCTAWPTEVPCRARREQQRADLDWWLTCAPSLLGQDAQQCPFSPGPPGSRAVARRAALRVGVCASGASPLPPGLSSVSLVLHILAFSLLGKRCLTWCSLASRLVPCGTRHVHCLMLSSASSPDCLSSRFVSRLKLESVKTAVGVLLSRDRHAKQNSRSSAHS